MPAPSISSKRFVFADGENNAAPAGVAYDIETGTVETAALDSSLQKIVANTAPISVAVTMTPGGDAVAPGRRVEILCTVAGDVSIQLAGGMAHVIAIPASPDTQFFPYSAVGINANGTTATATYSNLS
jgi:hypothetical protein